MKTIIALIFALFCSISASAQHVYQGGSVYNTKLATWDGHFIYQGGSVYNTKLYTFDGRHVYQGGSVYNTKLLTLDTTIPIPILYLILGN